MSNCRGGLLFWTVSWICFNKTNRKTGGSGHGSGQMSKCPFYLSNQKKPFLSQQNRTPYTNSSKILNFWLVASLYPTSKTTPCPPPLEEMCSSFRMKTSTWNLLLEPQDIQPPMWPTDYFYLHTPTWKCNVMWWKLGTDRQGSQFSHVKYDSWGRSQKVLVSEK